MLSRTLKAFAAVFAVVLTAAATVAYAAPRHPPAGSYQASCRNVVFSNAGILTAQCKDQSGRLVDASLRITACGKGDVANTNGLLTCPPLYEARAKPLPAPLRGAMPSRGNAMPGALILYDDIDFKGATLEVAGDAENLVLRNFNDKASSIRIMGGQWQLCVDIQYRGHCTVLDKDSPNLSRFSLNNRVSSIRRVD